MSLPGTTALAGYFTGITETMLGLSFRLAAEQRQPWEEQPAWRAAVLPIPGRRCIDVAVACDEACARLIGAAIFRVPKSHVDLAMMDDSLRELANIVAGQVKLAMGLDQALGLPRIVDGTAVRRIWNAATLDDGVHEARVWVAVTDDTEED